jgi:hypothetical protein
LAHMNQLDFHGQCAEPARFLLRLLLRPRHVAERLKSEGLSPMPSPSAARRGEARQGEATSRVAESKFPIATSPVRAPPGQRHSLCDAHNACTETYARSCSRNAPSRIDLQHRLASRCMLDCTLPVARRTLCLAWLN